MMEEEMGYVGDVQILGNTPCVRCKDADTCETSGIKILFGPEATVAETEIGLFEEQPEVIAAAVKPGKETAAILQV